MKKACEREKTAQLFKVQIPPGSLGYRRLCMQRNQRDAKGLLTDLDSIPSQMTNIKKWRGGPRAPAGSPASRETNSSLTFYKTPKAAGEDGLSPNGDEQEADGHVWTGPGL